MTTTDGLYLLEQRNVNGSGNNLANPDWGIANSQFSRLAGATYADGVGAMEQRGSAREISNVIVDQQQDVASTAGASDLLTFFGQFIDHDIDLALGASNEQVFITVPADDEVFDPSIPLVLERSAYAAGTGVGTTPRAQINEITSFVDASNIYGSHEEITTLLRADGGDSAYLLTSPQGHAPTLGQLRAIYPNLDTDHPDLIAGAPTDDAYVGGDVRINENVALTAMHSVWISEHNYQVAQLRAEHPDWTEDQLFDAAKVIVEALYQNVVFNEYMPFLLGEQNIPDYQGYNASIDPSISTEFATAAFRLGHSQLSSLLHRTNEDGSTVADGNLNLFDAFFSPNELTNGGGPDALVRGLAGHTSQEIDENIVDDVRNLLFANLGTGTDLASLNIVRGRDHGIPTLNDMRVALGLPAYGDFSELTADPVLAAQFAEVYASIDDVDLWVGGLAEEKVPGSQLGSTFHAIVLDQFIRLRDGDRLYFETRLEAFPELLEEIGNTSFSDILLRNTGIDYLQDDVFIAHTRIGGTEGDDYLRGTTDHDLIIGFDGNDQLVGRRGDDDLHGGAGDDYLRGGRGNDVLDGEGGDDTLSGGADNDKLTGGAGVDWLGGDGGDDLLVGGSEHDVLEGASGNDVLYGDTDTTLAGYAVSDFDALYGGNGHDTLVGDAAELAGNAMASADYLEGGKGNDVLIGDAFKLTESAHGGDDHVRGGAGDDILYGDAEFADPGTTGGDDYLVAEDGNDTLVGGGGNDYMVGGNGNDTFVFAPGSGVDVIEDFSPGDVLDVSAYGFTDLSELVVFDNFGDTVIIFTSTDDLTLRDVNAAALDADDFQFA